MKTLTDSPPAPARDRAVVVRVRGLTKRYGSVTALDQVDLTFEEGKVYGLLGRNGAGKTTIMQTLTGQIFPTTGEVEVFGAAPAENADVLRRLCFVAEAQKYPDSFRASHVLRSAPWFFERWDGAFADVLAEAFGLPLDRPIKKLSRGQLSTVGVIVGLASRAPLTFFDEPYLGLDAVARQLFYDRLLADLGEHPRTVVVSTHLIDEVANLLEHVVLVDRGRVLLDQDVDELRGSMTTVAGVRAAVDRFVDGRAVVSRQTLGALTSVTVAERLGSAERRHAAQLGLELGPVSLQQLVVHLTDRADAAPSTPTEVPV
ncbi:MAG: ABC transporter ATP-binding protein [Dermatophilaceae bacterium]